MNNRQRFRATMHYQPVDRAPLYDFGFWDETIELWHNQGLPAEVSHTTAYLYFGMDCDFERLANAVGAQVGLEPPFESRVISDDGEHITWQRPDGVQERRRKFMGSIPHPVGRILTDRQAWQIHYKPRLTSENINRYPADWETRRKQWLDPNYPNPLILWGGSLYGWLRDWIGMENLSMIVYDDPAWFEEMVTTLADCTIGVLTRFLESGAQFDGCSMWEDMAYNGGPLLSPKHFKKYLVPHYRRIADLLHRYGVDIIWVDCDGKIDELIPLWLEAGINTMFPLEVGVWGADPIAYRRQYGKDLRLMGGFDKRILASTPEAIEREVYRLLPLVEEGGYIGFCDHRVPPDVPLENYIHYLKTVRRVWGKDVNLRPAQFS